ncbi:membrane-bound lytic murein transglycosylase [Methylophilaceae bacterium 11]|nr:membrane-bound lytic murein transglycosylase [Methylophilaceae bacterium 11]
MTTLRLRHHWLIIFLTLMMITACGKKNIKEPIPCRCEPSTSQPSKPIPEPVTPETKPEAPGSKIPEYGLLKLANWSEIDAWKQDNLSAGWPAWLTSCSTLKNKPEWQPACQAAVSLIAPDNTQIIEYFTHYFNVYSTSTIAGSNTGLITGYYEPVLKGSRTKSAQYAFPLYAQPKDLITVDLGTLFPELKYKRVRGKLDGNRLVPYFTRAEIESDKPPLAGSEIVWIDDAIDAFFLQIQGSGLIQLDTGEQLHLGYADQNGHAYNSIGKVLIQRGELNASQASMQGIKDWGRKNVSKLRELLNTNPSYVFFRELPANLPGPLGALGVPLTAERSVAIDPKYIPLGAPVYLSTTYPNTTKPLQRLMIAQDTGGAIKDGVRADFYWGSGNYAGKMAGSMKQSGMIWVLLPKEFKLPVP